MKFKKKNIRGLSLTEVLIAMTISTLIFSAAYLMYDQFKASFERQLGLSDLQGEARVAILNLDLDTKKAGYSTPNTLPVKRPVLTPTNSISFCYDEKTVRKRVVYSLNTTDKTITRSVYEVSINSITDQTNNCNPDGIATTTITPTTTIVANKVNSFSGTIQGNVIIVKISLQSSTGNEDETYNERFFLKNYDKCPPVALTSGLILNFDACDEINNPNNQTATQKVWFNKGTGGSTYNAEFKTHNTANGIAVSNSGTPIYTSNEGASYFSTRRGNPRDAILTRDFFTFSPILRKDMSWGVWFKTQDAAVNQGHYWWGNAMIIGHERPGATINDWGISMGGGKICWGSASSSSANNRFRNNLDGSTDQAFCTTNSNYNDGNWHYLVVTRTNGNSAVSPTNSEVIIYIDGSAVQAFVLPYGTPQITNSTAINSGDRDINGVIGIAASDASTTGWNADIAAVQGYNRILTANEITRNWNSQRSRFGL